MRQTSPLAEQSAPDKLDTRPSNDPSTAANNHLQLLLADEARQSIQAQMLPHLRALARLREQMNALLPVSRLPPELLIQIFACHVAMHAGGGHSHYGWIQITHVCSLWRTIAITSPVLWNHICVTASTNWMLELLRRSGRIALSVTADFPLDPTPTLNRHSAWLASLRLVLRELPRIRELRIHAAGDVLESSLAAVDGGPTKMERLELANVGGLVDQEALKHSLSKLLANERARALRRLELTEFPYCWGDAVSFLSLRHLQLICAPESTSKPSIPELLERLSVLSTLETLRMEHVVHPLPESSEEPPVKRQTVKLPRLRYLRLAGRMIDNANILNHLHLPVDVVVSVSVSTDEDVNQHSDVLALAITAKVSDAKPICGLVMRDEGPLCFHARMLLYNMDILPPHVCDESIHADYSSTLAGAQLEIEFEETWTAWNTMAVICRQLPLTDIRSLEISGRLSTTAATEWNTIAVQMDHLTSMKVCGSVGEMFLRASIPEEVDIPDNSPLPALRDLHLHNVMCRDTHLYDNPHDDIMRPQLDPDSNVLYLWLVDRHRRGAKVDRVAVQACRNIDRKDVRLCKQLVDTLLWDRYVDIVDTATFLKRAGVYDSDSDDY